MPVYVCDALQSYCFTFPFRILKRVRPLHALINACNFMLNSYFWKKRSCVFVRLMTSLFMLSVLNAVTFWNLTTCLSHKDCFMGILGRNLGYLDILFFSLLDQKMSWLLIGSHNIVLEDEL